MKRTWSLGMAVLALAVAALLVLAGCSSAAPAAAPTNAPDKAAEPTKASAPATSAPAAQSSKPIEVKIGLITPLSGDVKTYGESVKNAYELAIEEANKAGKVKITT
ncbi:MAG: ABC transporter substrate-binding protein, partial [Chloroflexota bacterium]